MKKKALSILTALALCLSLLAVPAWAAESAENTVTVHFDNTETAWESVVVIVEDADGNKDGLGNIANSLDDPAQVISCAMSDSVVKVCFTNYLPGQPEPEEGYQETQWFDVVEGATYGYTFSPKYGVWVGGVEVTEENANDVLGDGTVSYSPVARMLTLNGADITESYMYTENGVAGIYVKGDLNLSVNGENRVKLESQEGVRLSSAIRVKGSLIIDGEGSLDLRGGDVSAQGTGAESYGIYFSDDLQVYTAQVNAEGGKATADQENEAYSSGVYGWGDLCVDFGGTLQGVGGRAEGWRAYSSGIEAWCDEDEYGNVAVYDGKLSGTGGDALATGTAGSCGMYLMYCGLYAYEDGAVIHLTSDHAESTGADGYAYSNGIYVYAGDVGIRAGTVTISGGSWEGEKGDGVAAYLAYEEDEYGFSGGNLDIECGSVSMSPYGPWVEGTTVVIEAVDDIAVYAQGGIDLDDGLIIATPEGGEIAGQGERDEQTYLWDYYTFVDGDGQAADSVAIEPLTYSVTITGLSFGRKAIVPPGQSLNEAYCELLGIDDFSEALDTEKDGYVFDGWYTDPDFAADSKFSFDDPVEGDLTIYPKWTEDSQAGGGAQEQSNLNMLLMFVSRIDVEESALGTVKLDRAYAFYGSTVTLSVRPNWGCALDSITVTDRSGNELPLTKKSTSEYTFKAPLGGVSVEADFHRCAASAFADVAASDWYHDAVDYTVGRGLMTGTGNGLFDPNGAANRALLVTALWKLEGSPVVNYLMTYEDVPQDAEYAEAVRWATAMGLVNGFSDGTFRGEDPVTREQLATLLYRYEQLNGGGFTGAWMFLLPYADRSEVSEWAYEGVCWNTMHGIMQSSTDTFDPHGTASRAHVAQLLKDYLERGN